MIELQYLQQKPNGLSRQNEPENHILVTSDIRRYPNMASVYSTFREKMDIRPERSIILGNGFEGVFKSVLSALRTRSLFFNTPLWMMVDIICEQYDIKKVTSEFQFDGKTFHPTGFLTADCAYFTIHNGPLFEHEDIDITKVSEQYRNVILDISYCSLAEMKSFLNIPHKNVIVVGSFDKIYGCGLRCGFCSFDNQYIDRMMLCRERYVSSQVEQFIINEDFLQPNLPYLESIVEEFGDIITFHSFNYITINDGLFEVQSNCKKIMVDGHKFIRFGIPSNESEYKRLREDLLNARNR